MAWMVTATLAVVLGIVDLRLADIDGVRALRGLGAVSFYRLLWLVPAIGSALAIDWLWRIRDWRVTAFASLAAWQAWMGVQRVALQLTGYAPRPTEMWLGRPLTMGWLVALPQWLVAALIGVWVSYYILTLDSRSRTDVVGMGSVGSASLVIVFVALGAGLNWLDAQTLLVYRSALAMSATDMWALQALSISTVIVGVATNLGLLWLVGTVGARRTAPVGESR
jgi:hypothetical protein